MRRTTSLAIAGAVAAWITLSSGSIAYSLSSTPTDASVTAGTSADPGSSSRNATASRQPTAEAPAPAPAPLDPDATAPAPTAPAPAAPAPGEAAPDPAPTEPAPQPAPTTPATTPTTPEPTTGSGVTPDTGSGLDARSAEQFLTTQAATQTVIASFPKGTHRLAGADRFATSVEVSRRYSPGVPVVYIATGSHFADGLASAAAAARVGGPLLLTQADVLPEVVRTEIIRLKPARIVVAGGVAAVSPAVFEALAKLTPQITRLGGADWPDTAELINADAFPWATTAYLATGLNFPDALAASAVAGAQGAPVFLVNGYGSSVPASTLQRLRDTGVTTVRIAGSSATVSAAIERHLSSSGFTVFRDQGPDRFATAVALNDAFFGGRAATESAFLATGSGFADALAGAALAGRMGVPLYLVRQECTPQATSNSLLALSPDSRIILGGTPSVGDQVARGDVCIEWAKPASGRITDVYGPREPICTPGGCTSSFHRGTDLGTGCWSPIYAVTSGTVTTARAVGTFGNFVRISHGGGIDTGYAHLANGGILVTEGQYVSTGQQIGWSGATGAATGCHLHFEVYVNGTQTDPVPFMAARGVVLA